MTRSGGRNRSLTAEDRRLWEEVRRSVRPLDPVRDHGRSSGAGEDIGDEDLSQALKAKPGPPSHRPLPSWQPPMQSASPARLAHLDDKTVRKLKKGKLAIDARIDLHGMAESRAHNALNRFLEHARRQDHRIVLVITGKGERSGGVLRRAVPRWLAEPPLVHLVGSWRQAHVTHGGEGALYVRLRRLPATRSARSRSR
jgi:DNA-nicking Smr family endonuclease